MASKINPKGVFKSNTKPKGPNPRGINKVSPAAKINPKGINPVKPGINSGGINPGGIKKPIVKSNTPSSTNSTTTSGSSNRTSRPVKTGGKPVRAGAKPVRVGSTSPTNTSSTTSTPRTNTIAKAEPLSSKSANRTSRPVRSGSKPVRTGSKPVRTGSKQIKTGKGTSFKVGAKPVSGSTSVVPKSSFASKAGNVLGKVGKVAGKIGRVAGTLGLAYQVADAVISSGPKPGSALNTKAKKDAMKKFQAKHKSDNFYDQVYNEVTGKYAKDKDLKKAFDDKKKATAKKTEIKKDNTNTGKPQVGGNRSAKTLIETPSLKDELKKRGVDFKPVKDKAKTNWLDTAKKGDTLKYVINKPKAETKKEDSKKGALPKAIDKAVRAIDGNQPGSGESLKFKGDKSKVAGKDKWGRSPSSKWYGFNPESKKYEAPTMVKGDNKKSNTKVETKKPATTPKVTAPKTTTPKASTPAVKKAESVDTSAPKSTTEIANKSLEEDKTITPAKTTTPAATSTSSESSASTTTSSPKVTGVQPRASFINRVRGVVNKSRERRAGRAASRGNEERSERLKEKISETEKKMMMKKGGVVKSKTKKK